MRAWDNEGGILLQVNEQSLDLGSAAVSQDFGENFRRIGELLGVEGDTFDMNT